MRNFPRSMQQIVLRMDELYRLYKSYCEKYWPGIVFNGTCKKHPYQCIPSIRFVFTFVLPLFSYPISIRFLIKNGYFALDLSHVHECFSLITLFFSFLFFCQIGFDARCTMEVALLLLPQLILCCCRSICLFLFRFSVVFFSGQPKQFAWLCVCQTPSFYWIIGWDVQLN